MRWKDLLLSLFGVGVSWYTWLEQGRNINVSDQILSRLADTLRLNGQERSHLFLLARGPLPLSDEQGDESLERPFAYQAILDGWGIYPALLVDQHLNVVAMTKLSAFMANGRAISR